MLSLAYIQFLNSNHLGLWYRLSEDKTSSCMRLYLQRYKSVTSIDGFGTCSKIRNNIWLESSKVMIPWSSNFSWLFIISISLESYHLKFMLTSLKVFFFSKVRKKVFLWIFFLSLFACTRKKGPEGYAYTFSLAHWRCHRSVFSSLVYF